MGRPRQSGEDELTGFAGCARAVNAAFGLSGEAGFGRRALEQWSRRGTRNAAGTAAPWSGDWPAVFRPAEWVAWVRPGVPVPHFRGAAFETPAERAARYAKAPLDKVRTKLLG